MAHITEQSLANMKDFMSLYNMMSEMCFSRCVINLNNRALSEEEKLCTDVCAEKQLKFNNRITGVFTVGEYYIMQC